MTTHFPSVGREFWVLILQDDGTTFALLSPPSAYFHARSTRIRNKRAGWRCNSPSRPSRRTVPAARTWRQLLCHRLNQQVANVDLEQADDRKLLHALTADNFSVIHTVGSRQKSFSCSRGSHKSISVVSRSRKVLAATQWMTSHSDTKPLTHLCLVPDEVSWCLFPTQMPSEFAHSRRWAFSSRLTRSEMSVWRNSRSLTIRRLKRSASKSRRA